MLRILAQTILDLYPDAISQFGLIGCGIVTAWAIFTLWCLYKTFCLYWFSGRPLSSYRWYN
jgi:hypothetical protein